MGWWKADPVPEPPQPHASTLTSSSIPQPPPPTSTSSASSSACPVDPKTRSIWLQQAQAQKNSAQSQLPPSHPPLPLDHPKLSTSPSQPQPLPPSKECSSDRISQSPSPPTTASPYKTSRPLSQDRAVSSIPRSQTATDSSSSTTTTPANAETETGRHSSGNWIYPSESQFFHAVMRKETLTSSNPEDLLSSISHIIPIHNAVNERAWSLIKAWESDSSEACGGPKLQSFRGLGAGALSPKARVKSLMGYTQPFDRHDWVVERCGGETVEYIIDFYQGKQDPNGKPNSLNFYLDVRPKLNTLEGCKMRAERFVGWR
ncbi:hypothetical protein H2204_000959 [Knufia peltigerae]|uniref:Holocytochrome c-type synthase n=1 Tax=Knufia peltigerae TaxID=1002370 RepID=A0AA38YEG2_9EURO|nr:hypothetical protein H2204_000959 [Knufia peltigerae]